MPADRAFQKVGTSDEASHKGGRRPAVHVLRGVELLDPAVAQHSDAIGKRERLGLIVRDEDCRRAEFLLKALQLQAHLIAQERVEITQRLIEKKKTWARYQGARESHALLLAA